MWAKQKGLILQVDYQLFVLTLDMANAIRCIAKDALRHLTELINALDVHGPIKVTATKTKFVDAPEDTKWP